MPARAKVAGKFAESLRAQGVEAEASRRFTRGVIRRGQVAALAHMPPEQSRVVQAKNQEAVREALEGAREEHPAERIALERIELVREAYGRLATELGESALPAAKALADDLQRLVGEMPELVTEREQRYRAAREAIERMERDRLRQERAQERGMTQLDE